MDAELPLELVLTLGDWPGRVQLETLARTIQRQQDFKPQPGQAPCALLAWGTPALPMLAESTARYPDTPSIVFTEACSADLAQTAFQFGADEVTPQNTCKNRVCEYVSA